MNDDHPLPGAGAQPDGDTGGKAPPSADDKRDTSGRHGSPDRGGRPADGSNAGEDFGGGFGGYQSGNQADPRGGDAGGVPDAGRAGQPVDPGQGTKPPDRT